MSGRTHFWPVAVVIGGLALLTGSSVGAGASFHVTPLTARHTLKAGSVVAHRIRVVNNSAEVASYTVRVKDFVTDSAGVDSWSAMASQPRSLGNWINFTPSVLTLPPGVEGFVDYEVRIPASQSLPRPEPAPEGSYWAALTVQGDSRRKAVQPVPGQATARFGIRVGFVYAIKIYVDIDGTQAPSLKAVALQAGEKAGGVVATFDNTGNVILKPKVWMEVRDEAGGVLATLDSPRWTLQPGRGHRYDFSIRDIRKGLPDGRYQVVVIADHGGARLLGLTAPLVLDGRAKP